MEICDVKIPAANEPAIIKVSVSDHKKKKNTIADIEVLFFNSDAKEIPKATKTPIIKYLGYAAAIINGDDNMCKLKISTKAIK